MTIRTNYLDFYTPQEWKQIMEDWSQSGLTISAYCRNKRIPLSSFCNWKGRLDPSSHRSIQDIRNKWKELIEEWHKSGLTKHAYCMEKEIFPDHLSKWERKLNFAPVPKAPIEKWKIIIEDWKKSGLKKYAYCRKQKIDSVSFYSWEKRINSSNLSSEVKDVQLDASLQSDANSLELRAALSQDLSYHSSKREVLLPQGHHLIFEGTFDWEKINQWIELLLKTKNTVCT